MYPPNSRLDRLVDAAVEPLSLDDAKAYLRVETAAEDALIADMIVAARLECERLTDRSFISTTWRLTLDYLPMTAGPFVGFPWPFGSPGLGSGGGSFRRVNAEDGGVALPMPPLIALSSLQYLDQSGVSRTLDPSQVIVQAGTPGRIYPSYGSFFPLSQPRAGAVTIVYTAGYGPDASSVPRVVPMAIRMLVAHYHRHRTSNAEVPDAVGNLLASIAWGAYA